MKTFNAVIFLKFLQILGLEYISNPHLVMWDCNPLTSRELHPWHLLRHWHITIPNCAAS